MAGLARDLKVAAINTTGTGAQDVIAAVADKKIHVTSIVLVASAASTVTLLSGSNALTGVMSLAANGGVSLTSPDSSSAILLCEKGEAFRINNSADGVDGWVVYYLT
jgi:hypothetical protein